MTVDESESRFERWRRTAVETTAAAGESRAALVRELAGAVSAVVRRTRIPLLVVGLLPLIPALVVAIEALALGGNPGLVLLALALGGAAPGFWLLWRRRRMMRAVDPSDELAAQLGEAYDIAGAWARAQDALDQVRSAGRGLRGAGQAVRGLWAGIQLSRDAFDQFSDLPRVAPFLPASLQFTGSLCLASVVSAVITGAVAVAGAGLVVAT